MQYVCECMYEVMYEMLEDNGLSKRVKEDRHYPIKRIVCGPLCTFDVSRNVGVSCSPLREGLRENAFLDQAVLRLA